MNISPTKELARHAPGSPTILTVGVFDGVHQGHISLLDTLKQRAAQRGLMPGVVTFSPHPIEVLHPGETLPLLVSVEERLQLLKRAGVPLVILLTFTRELSRLSPEDFVRLLIDNLHMRGLVLGPDFSLGKDRQGTIDMLGAQGKRLGFTVENVAAHTLDGRIVSSTAIRGALSRGHMGDAARMLGRPFSLSGPVVSTSRRGESLGFRTANVVPKPGRALPTNGVYATIATIPNGRFGSVTNVGHRPTFDETERIVETHILDFSGDLYGASLTVEFITRIRDEFTFEDPKALVAQIGRDVEAARSILGERI